MKIKLKPEAKEAWIKALRSGNYKQGRAILRTLDNEFCCLGVFCDINNVPAKEADVFVYNFGDYDEPNECATEPDGVWFRDFFEGDDVSLKDIHETIAYLIKMNDDFDYDFNQIADVIEQDL